MALQGAEVRSMVTVQLCAQFSSPALVASLSHSVQVRCHWLGCACHDVHATLQDEMCSLRVPQLIFYPTAIGTEPQDDKLDSYLHWARVMMGHAGANLVSSSGSRLHCAHPAVELTALVQQDSAQHSPQRRLSMRACLSHCRRPRSIGSICLQMPVIAANRVGKEEFPERREKTASSITFHGGSFITGPTGEIVAQVPRSEHDALLLMPTQALAYATCISAVCLSSP